MPNVAPIISNTFNFNDNLVIESSAMDFNQFNQGVISEKFTVVRFSVFSDNILQLDEQIVVDYIEPNGNRKQFAQSPRVDKYQVSNVLNCIEIPKILCDGLNRFSYRILPATEVIVVFEIDKRNSISQVFRESNGLKDDQNSAVIQSMFDGSDISSLSNEIMPNYLQQEYLNTDGEEYSNVNLRLKSPINNELQQKNKNKTINTILEIAAITIPFMVLLWGINKIYQNKNGD